MWNWPDATEVDLGPNTAWQGTILAPRAVVRLGYQQVNGPIVSGALYGTGETHLHPPNPCLPDPDALPAGATDPDPHADADDHPDADTDAGADEHADARADLDAEPTDPGADDDTDAGADEHAGADRDPDPHPDAADAEPAAPAGDGQQRIGAGLERRRADLQEGDAEGPRAREGPPARGREGEVPHPGDEHGDRRGAQRARVRSAAEAVQADQGVGEGDLPQRPPVRAVPLLKGQRQGFITIRITRTAKGTVTNVAAVSARDSGLRRNTARVRVLPARAAGGGVTG